MDRINGNVQYYYAQEKAYEVLLKYSNGKLPIDPFHIVGQIKNIKLMTYTDFAKELQKKRPELSLEEIKCEFVSDRGFLNKKRGKKYILAYNEHDDPYTVKWTLFHELGHYFLEHLNGDNGMLFSNVETYEEIKEKEVNCFARHCSSPMPIVKNVAFLSNYNEPTFFLMSRLFKMSEIATEICADHFDKYYNMYFNDKYADLLEKFHIEIMKHVFAIEYEYVTGYPVY